MKTTAEALQDTFAAYVGNMCGNLTYLEIGAAWPDHYSTSCVLDTVLGWKGFSVEYNPNYQLNWQTHTARNNLCFFENALGINYSKIAAILNLSKHMGYLSCDIEPPQQTFKALHRVLEQGFQFDCITFEHDAYYDTNNFETLAREFLTTQGYKVAVTDVYPLHMPNCHFETWFVKDHVQFPQMSFEQYRQFITQHEFFQTII